MYQKNEHIEYLCGMGSAMFSVFLTYPVNKLMFRQSLWGFDIHAAIRQLKIEGLHYLYRGVFPPIIIKSITSSVMFGTFNQYQHFLTTNRLLGPRLRSHDLWCTFLASMLSGTTEAMLTPLERVQMILQDGRWNNQYNNTFHAFYQLRRYGIAEYYRGLSAVLCRNGPSTFLYFGFKDRLKEYILPPKDNKPENINDRQEMIRNFITGSTIGSFISTLFYPLNVVRIHMQIQPVGTKHIGIMETMQRLYHERDGQARLLLSGIHINLFRSFLYWGCITAFSEKLRDYFHEHQF